MKVRRRKEDKKVTKKSEASGASVFEDDQLFAFTYEGVEYMTLLTRKFSERKPYSRPNPKLIHAFIPGTIVKVNVKEKARIKKGETLLSLQAMKMNNDIHSSIDGTVKKVHVKKGDIVVKNQLLVELK